MHTSSRSIGESGYLPAPWLGLSVGRRAASFTVSYASQFFDLSRFQSSYTLAYAALSWPLSLNRTASVTPNAFISFFSPFCRDTPVGTRCSCASPQSSWILFTPGIRVTGTTLFVRSANQTRIDRGSLNIARVHRRIRYAARCATPVCPFLPAAWNGERLWDEDPDPWRLDKMKDRGGKKNLEGCVVETDCFGAN